MTTISIRNDRGETIVGILENKKDILDAGRDRPRLVLIAHGVLGRFLLFLKENLVTVSTLTWSL